MAAAEVAAGEVADGPAPRSPACPATTACDPPPSEPCRAQQGEPQPHYKPLAPGAQLDTIALTSTPRGVAKAAPARSGRTICPSLGSRPVAIAARLLGPVSAYNPQLSSHRAAWLPQHHAARSMPDFLAPRALISTVRTASGWGRGVEGLSLAWAPGRLRVLVPLPVGHSKPPPYRTPSSLAIARQQIHPVQAAGVIGCREPSCPSCFGRQGGRALATARPPDAGAW